MDWGNVPNWVTAVVAVLGISAGLWQYRQAQKWKRAEWVAQEVKDFLRDPAVSNALWMLDWKDRSLPLLLPGGDPGKYFDYTEDM